jgi:ATP/maltotriose-dependent transcriptional regulator MalT
MTIETNTGSILRTKLHRPPVPRDHVHRQRLLAYLDQRRERHLTLVSAPAGYGKSVLISHWMETCDFPNAWFEGVGLIDESLKHALQADDVERAAQIVERHRQSALNDNQWYTLEKWPAQLPETAVQGRAELLMAQAWVFLHHFRFEAVFPILDQVESLLDDQSARKPLRGEVALIRIIKLRFDGAIHEKA